jgi:FKBP-type peptidyl-prolyl cis-trans isomerase 2
MKVRENTVVTLSYYFVNSQDEVSDPKPGKIYTSEVLIGRDMLPPDIELSILDRDEGDEITIPVNLHRGSGEQQEIGFFKLEELPEGIEIKKGMKIPVLRSNGSIDMILVQDMLSDGVIGRVVVASDDKPRWMRVRIDSVRWATLKEFQEGRVITKSGQHHGHHLHH